MIFSVIKHNCAFYCIDIGAEKSYIKDILNRLQVRWVLESSLSLNRDFVEESATCVKTMELLEGHELKLWEINVNYVGSTTYEGFSYVVLTSGTTGSNKVVKVTKDCIISNINCLR